MSLTTKMMAPTASTSQKATRLMPIVAPENSVQPMAESYQQRIDDSTRSRLALSLANEICRCTRARETVRPKFKGPRRCSALRDGIGFFRQRVVRGGGVAHRLAAPPPKTPFLAAESLVAPAGPFRAKDAFSTDDSTRNKISESLSAMLMPSLSSSPWMRGAPQRGFSRHILRIRSRTSREMTGLSGLAAPHFPGAEQSKRGTLPSNDGFRLDDGERRAPVAPEAAETAGTDPQEAVAGG